MIFTQIPVMHWTLTTTSELLQSDYANAMNKSETGSWLQDATTAQRVESPPEDTVKSFSGNYNNCPLQFANKPPSAPSQSWHLQYHEASAAAAALAP